MSAKNILLIVGICLACAVGDVRGQTAGGQAGQRPPARDGSTPAPTGTASITGTVTAEGSNARPIRRALVTLSGAELRGNRQAITDDAGGYGIRDLPAGRFTLSVTKPGYLIAYYGGTKPGRGPGTPIAVTDGATVTGIDMKMQWGAVITGTVTDQTGMPQALVRVQVMEARVVNGERTFQYVGGISQATDDRGVYRIYGLPAGDFVVGASSLSSISARLTTPEEIRWAQQQGAAAGGPSIAASSFDAAGTGPDPGQTVGYAPIYYAGTPDASAATPVSVRAGEERTGVDFSIQFVPTAKVEGVIRRADGQSVQGTLLYLFPNARVNAPLFLESGLSNRFTAGADGKFTFRSVRPGQYTLTARASSRPAGPPAPGTRPGPPVMDLWALADVTVTGRDVSGISATLEPGMTVSGRIVFEAKTLTPPADLTRVSVSLRVPPAATGITLGVPTSQATAESTFAFQGVTPGRYQIWGNAPAPPGTPTGIGSGWQLKSAMLKGREILDAPFEIRPNEDVADIVLTFTDQMAELSGALLDAAGRPAPEYFVFLFPTDKSQWFQGARRMRQPTRPSTDGRYRLPGLPPGEYYVSALTQFEPTDVYDASFLEQLISSSFKITLAEGEKKTQDLKLAGGK
jgi:hypothetical protein